VYLRGTGELFFVDMEIMKSGLERVKQFRGTYHLLLVAYSSVL
jgi:hypothetical protein